MQLLLSRLFIYNNRIILNADTMNNTIQLIEQARLAIIRNDISEAQSILNRVLALEPNNAEARWMLDNLYNPSISSSLLTENHSTTTSASLIAAQAYLDESVKLDPYKHPYYATRNISINIDKTRFPGETEDAYATRLAKQAEMVERARLDGDPWIPAEMRSVSPLMYGPYGKYIKVARFILYIAMGNIISIGAAYVKIRHNQIPWLIVIALGTICGAAMYFTPYSPPRSLRRRR